MGFGISDIVNEIGSWFGNENLGNDLFGGGGGIRVDPGTGDQFVDDLARRAFGQLSNLAWAQAIPTGRLEGRMDYLGEGFYPVRVGWPLEVGVEAISVGGKPAEGTFFIGHAPDCLFDALTMTQAGVALDDDPSINAGFSARVVQRTPEGRTVFVSGFETGLEPDGTILRGDLQMFARSPFTARIAYGGPLIPGLPMFVIVRPFGDFAPVPDFTQIQVQVTTTLLVQELAATEADSPTRLFTGTPRIDASGAKRRGDPPSSGARVGMYAVKR